MSLLKSQKRIKASLTSNDGAEMNFCYVYFLSNIIRLLRWGPNKRQQLFFTSPARGGGNNGCGFPGGGFSTEGNS